MAVIEGTDEEFVSAQDTLIAALDAYADPDEALDALNELVATRLDVGLREATDETAEDDARQRASWLVRLYGAAAEDFYVAIELPLLAWEVRLNRGRLALDLDRLDEAEDLVRAAALGLAEEPELCAGSPWHLLGTALDRQGGRTEEAIDAFGRAAELSSGLGEPALAAESYDELGRLIAAEDPERAISCFTGAVAQWRLAGNEEEATASQALSGWAAYDVVRKAYDDGDLDRRLRFAILARELSLGIDAELTGLSELQQAIVLFERMDLTAATPLLTSAGRTLDSVDDHQVQAYGALSLALGHTLSVDLEAAEPAIRRALAMAEHLDDDELVAQLLEMLAASAQMRFDTDSASAIRDAVLGRLHGENSLVARDREQLMNHLVSNNVVAARHHAEQMVERWSGIPDARNDVVFALGLLVMFDGVLRDAAAAAGRMQLLEELIAAERGTGNLLGVYALEWMRPLIAAFAALAQGDQDRFGRILLERHDELLAAGSTMMAARVIGVLGLSEHWSGRPWSAIEWLLPANLGLLRQLSVLPSSAERAALRSQLQHAVAAMFEAVAATGDARLLSELIEAVRAQGVPDPVGEGSTDNRSVSALLGSLLPGPAEVAPAWIEQETMLPEPPLVVMPWGSVALERFVVAGERYVSARIASTRPGRVRLVVPR